MEETNEIDLCARIGGLLGTSCNLAANGSKERDLTNHAPVFEVEVKYLMPKRTNWPEVKADWDWLLAVSNNNENFRKRAMVLFWPSTSLYKFTTCLSVTRDQGQSYSSSGFAPFAPYAEPEMPPNGQNQRLRFKNNIDTGPYGIQIPDGKRVRLDIVGAKTHPLWCAIYTRLTPDEYNLIPADNRLQVSNGPINLNGIVAAVQQQAVQP
jgi:hypothetical protein